MSRARHGSHAAMSRVPEHPVQPHPASPFPQASAQGFIAEDFPWPILPN